MNDFWLEVVRPILRPYQIDVRDRVRNCCAILKRAGKPVRVILQCATGGGKSVIALDLILHAHDLKKRVLFVVSGRALVNQFETYLFRANLPYGVIMAGRGGALAPIQLASKETLAARALRKQRMTLPEVDLVLIDECHESMAQEWQKLLNHYCKAVVVGLTATPAFGNGKGLGRSWHGLERAVPIRQLVEENWLVKCRVFAPDKPDLRGVKIGKDGDYVKEDLAKRMDRPKITGNVVEHWKKYAQGRPTVVFGCTIEHAKHICKEFNEAGFPFGHINQGTVDDERAAIFRQIEEGKLCGFTNVGVARRGLDLPCLSCACIVRPTRSLVLWLQMIGRIRRPHNGKTDCIVIDHAGACHMHCMPDDEIEWSLDAKERIGDWLSRQKDQGKIKKSHTCPQCSCVFSGTSRCPECGCQLRQSPKETKPIHHGDGLLVEQTQSNGRFTYEQLQTGYNRIIGSTVNARFPRKAGAVAAIFKEDFGLLPWEVRPKLANLPPREKGVWQKLAIEVWPRFRKAKT
jgi:DNA repair protein RadD